MAEPTATIEEKIQSAVVRAYRDLGVRGRKGAFIGVRRVTGDPGKGGIWQAYTKGSTQAACGPQLHAVSDVEDGYCTISVGSCTGETLGRYLADPPD